MLKSTQLLFDSLHLRLPLPQSCSSLPHYRLVSVVSLHVLFFDIGGESTVSETPFRKTGKPLIAWKKKELVSWLRVNSLLVDCKPNTYNQDKK